MHFKDATKQNKLKCVPVQKSGGLFRGAGASSSSAPPSFDELQKIAYGEAIKLWNEQDKSSRDRIAVSGESDV